MLDAILAFFTPEMIAQMVKAVIGLVVFFLTYLILNRIIKKIVFWDAVRLAM